MTRVPHLADNESMRAGTDALRTRAVLFESVLLVLITIADIGWTIYLVERGLAIEANPLMARLLDLGPAIFTSVKLLYLLPLIAVCEWLRSFRPVFATASIRCSLVGYLAIYVVGELSLHGLV